MSTVIMVDISRQDPILACVLVFHVFLAQMSQVS